MTGRRIIDSNGSQASPHRDLSQRVVKCLRVKSPGELHQWIK